MTKHNNGGKLFIEALKKRNINRIYCCPGTTEVSIIDACADEDDFDFILFPFEGSAVAAADGHSRVTGTPQIVMLHANVGLANGISQIYSAKMSHSPIVVINVIKPQGLLSHGGITTTTHEQEMVKQYTKWDWQSLRSEELVEDLNRAFQMAIKPPQGPTLLVIPQDVLEAPACENSVYSFPRCNVNYRSAPADEDIDRAAHILAESSFPLIVSGTGAGKENCIDEVKELADMLGAGVCCESKWSFYYNGYPTTDRRFLGPYEANTPAAEKADVILALGAKLFAEFTIPATPEISRGTKLLHQHEDMKEIDKLYRADVPLCGNTRETVRKLKAALAPLLGEKKNLIAYRNKTVEMLNEQRGKEVEAALKKAAAAKPIRIASLVEGISQVMNEKTTVVVDTPTSDAHLVEYLKRPNSKSLYGQSCGSLGWGSGAALGVKCGDPKQRVICFTGDGSLLFGVQSIWTAFKYNIPVVFVVINNQRYAAVRKGLLHYKGVAVEKDIYPGTDISGIDYCALANSFSVEAEKISEGEAIAPALEKALQKEKPYLLEVMVDPDDF